MYVLILGGGGEIQVSFKGGENNIKRENVCFNTLT
jgi:hypothetical protein